MEQEGQTNELDALEVQVRSLVDARSETRNLDYKGPMSFGPGRAEKAEILKDILAMSNTRDGGSILVGISEADNGTFTVEGISSQQAKSFDITKIGDFARDISSAQPNLTSSPIEIDGKLLLLISVREFEEVPLVCIKTMHSVDGKIVLRAGGIYIRTVSAKSVEIGSAEDMQLLIDTAIQKRGDGLIRQIQRLVGTSGIEQLSPPAKDPYESEEESAKDFLGRKIPDASHWFFSLAPTDYVDDRIDSNSKLRDIRRNATVSLRGWDFPHTDSTNDVPFESGVESWTTSSRGFMEAHRFYHSGLFTWRSNFSEDFSPSYENSLNYVGVIYTVTEFFLFAARLAPEISSDASSTLKLGVLGLNDRPLKSDSMILWHNYETGAAQFVKSIVLPVEQLRANHLEVANQLLRSLFELYDLNVDKDVITTWQNKLINRQF